MDLLHGVNNRALLYVFFARNDEEHLPDYLEWQSDNKTMIFCDWVESLICMGRSFDTGSLAVVDAGG